MAVVTTFAAFFGGRPLVELPGVCQVTVSVLNLSGQPLPGCDILVQLRTGSNLDGFAIERTSREFTTDVNGIATFDLIKRNEFSVGGVYRIRCWEPDGTKLIFDKLVYSSNAPFANIDDLEVIEL